MSGTGTKLRLDDMENMAANKIVGTTTAGAPVEIDCTSAGRALLDDAAASDQLTTLGLVAAAKLNKSLLHLDIADGSAEAVYYVVSPFAGSISKIWTVVDGVVSTANITVTAAIGATGVTGGVVTIPTAASAAGDVASASPSALNVVTAGQAINFTVTGGGAGGSPRIHLVAEITRT